jgi:hypothetical protein
MMFLLSQGFSQTEIILGHYLQYRIVKCGLDVWKPIEDILKKYRGTQFFSFTTWLLYSPK